LQGDGHKKDLGVTMDGTIIGLLQVGTWDSVALHHPAEEGRWDYTVIYTLPNPDGSECTRWCPR
jgi:hypothetical protein